jgi:uncharacterized YccA/Bax inhibitor family protein
MGLLDWLFVLFGLLVAFAGLWMRRRPGQVFAVVGASPMQAPKLLAQVSLLGACFLLMGCFFAVQMAADLAHQPWWIGSVGGLAVALVATGGSSYRSKAQRAQSSAAQALEAR